MGAQATFGVSHCLLPPAVSYRNTEIRHAGSPPVERFARRIRRLEEAPPRDRDAPERFCGEDRRWCGRPEEHAGVDSVSPPAVSGGFPMPTEVGDSNSGHITALFESPREHAIFGELP